MIAKPTQIKINSGFVIIYEGLQLKTTDQAIDQYALHLGVISPVKNKIVTVKDIIKNLYGTYIRVEFEGFSYDLKPQVLNYISKS